jgi:hypothetical protein
LLITVTLERALSTLLLIEIELFQLPAILPMTMTVTSGNDKSDLLKQNVSVCFFSEQKCTCSNSENIILNITLSVVTIKICSSFSIRSLQIGYLIKNKMISNFILHYKNIYILCRMVIQI